MNKQIQNIIRYLILLVLSGTFSLVVEGQSILEVIGIAEQDMSPVQNAKVTLNKDGREVQTVYTDRKGEFKFQLDVNSEYLIEINKQGLLPKKIAFNTEIPAEIKGQWTMEFAMSLYPGCPGVNTSVLDDPVDRVKYSTNKADFISDEGYVRNMRGRMERLLMDIENCQTEQYQDAMSEGNQLLKEGNYAAAQEKFEEALEVYPDDRTAQRKMNEAQKNMGQSQQTEQAYDQAVAEADRMFEAKDYEGAREKYTEALTRKQDNYAQNKLKEVDQLINLQRQQEQASQQTDREYNNLISQGNAAYTRQDYESAQAYYQQALQKKPNASFPRQKVYELESLIAQKQQARNKQEAVEKSYTEAMAMGQSAMQSQDYDAARQHFNRALMMKPSQSLPRQKMSEIDRIEEEQRKISAQANKAAARKKVDDALNEGDNLLAQNNYDGAEAAYQRALGLDPNDAYAKQQLRKVRSERENAAAQKQRAREKSYADNMRQGDELLASGSFDQSINAYRQAMRHKPNDAAAQSKIQIAVQRKAAQQQQLANEQARKRQYEDYLAAGNRFFDAKQYNQAKQSYQNAQNIYPAQAAPRNRINEIDRILGQQQKDQQYQQVVSRADGLFNSKDYSQAKTAYQQALTLKADQAYPRQKIAEIDQLMVQQQQAATQQRQRDQQYAQLIREGDNLFTASRLTEAKSTYQRAQNLKAGETYPRQQITKIDQMLAQQQQQEVEQRAQEQKYKDLIARADGQFSSRDYAQAKTTYQQALAVKATEAYPRQRIAEIDRLIMQQQQQAAVEQRQLDQQYSQAIREADNLFNASQLGQAKSAYQRAQAIKSGEAYPQQQIAKIDQMIAQQQQQQQAQQRMLDQQYTQAVREADNLFNSSRLPEAKIAYQRAQGIKSSEAYPQQQITRIDGILAEQAKRENAAKAKELQYNQAIAQADQAYRQNDLPSARSGYQNAMRIKPGESYPTSQIAKIDQQLAQMDRERQEKAAFEQKYQNLIAQADRAYDSRQYPTAKQGYMEALKLKPSAQHPQQRLNKIAEFERIIAAREANQRTTTTTTTTTTSQSTSSGPKSKLAVLNFANESERQKYLNSLRGQYPPGVTLEVHKERTSTTNRYVVIRGNEVSEYRKVKFSWGGVEYSDNGIPTTGQYFDSQVKVRPGEFYQEFNY